MALLKMPLLFYNLRPKDRMLKGNNITVILVLFYKIKNYPLIVSIIYLFIYLFSLFFHLWVKIFISWQFECVTNQVDLIELVRNSKSCSLSFFNFVFLGLQGKTVSCWVFFVHLVDLDYLL